MARVGDVDLVELIAYALHRSGPSGNAERVDLEFARIRAGIVVRALHSAGMLVIREELPGRRSAESDKADAKAPG